MLSLSPPLCSAFFCGPRSLVGARWLPASCTLSKLSRKKINPQWCQPGFWNWASVSLPVWDHVLLPEPTNAARGHSPDWPDSGVRDRIISSQIAWTRGEESPRKIWVLSFPKRGPEPRAGNIKDVFYRPLHPIPTPTCVL